MSSYIIYPGYEGVTYAEFALAGLTVVQTVGHVYLTLTHEKRDEAGRLKMLNAFNLQLLGMELSMIGIYAALGSINFYTVEINPYIHYFAYVLYYACYELFEVCYIQYTWTRCFGAFQIVFRPFLPIFNILCRYVVPVIRLVELILVSAEYYYGFFGNLYETPFYGTWMFEVAGATRIISTIIDLIMGAAFIAYIRSAPTTRGNTDNRLVTVSKYGMAASVAYLLGDLLYYLSFTSWAPPSLIVCVLATDSVIILILQAMKWKLKKFKLVNASEKPKKSFSKPVQSKESKHAAADDK